MRRRALWIACAAAAIVAAGAAARATSDNGAGTYTGTGPTYTFSLSNTGTTTWRYVYLVGPTTSNFVGGQSPSGTCIVGQPDGTPNELECGPMSAGPGAGVQITGTLGQPVTCGTPFSLFVNSTGTPPYTHVPDVTFGGTCSTPPPPPPPSSGNCDDELIRLARAQARLKELIALEHTTSARYFRASNLADEYSEQLDTFQAADAFTQGLIGGLDAVKDLEAAADRNRDAMHELSRQFNEIGAARRAAAAEAAAAAAALVKCRATQSARTCGAQKAKLAGAQARVAVIKDGIAGFRKTGAITAQSKMHALTARVGKAASRSPKVKKLYAAMRPVDAFLTQRVTTFVAYAKTGFAAAAAVTKAKKAVASCSG